MSKSAVLLLIAAVVIGLLVAFNPEARQKALQSWDVAKTTFVKVETDVSVKVHDWAAQQNADQQSDSGSNPNPFAVAWKQISSTLEAFWNSLQKFWAQLTAGTHLNGS
jgi:uncharacterized membrane protein YraQ (UPF0718 family)